MLSGMIFSHEKLIQNNRSERRRFLRYLKKLQKQKRGWYSFDVEVEHDEKMMCCFREKWEDTSLRTIKEFIKMRKISRMED